MSDEYTCKHHGQLVTGISMARESAEDSAKSAAEASLRAEEAERLAQQAVYLTKQAQEADAAHREFMKDAVNEIRLSVKEQKDVFNDFKNSTNLEIYGEKGPGKGDDGVKPICHQNKKDIQAIVESKKGSKRDWTALLIQLGGVVVAVLLTWLVSFLTFNQQIGG